MATLHESSIERRTNQILSYKQEVKDRFALIRSQLLLFEKEKIEELDDLLLQLKNIDSNEFDSPSQNVTLSWNEQELTKLISSFCKIETAPVPTIIDRVWSSAQRGSKSDQLFRPHGLNIDRRTNDIYIADWYNKRIQVFNDSGKYKKSIFHPDILNFHRLLTVNNFLIVTDPMNRHIYKLNKESGEIEHSEELEYVPGGVDVKNEEIYIINFSQPLIYSYDMDLYEEGQINLNISNDINFNQEVHFLAMEFAHNVIYTLLENAFYRVTLFDFNGNTLSCIIPSSLVSKAFYFCVDAHQNVLVSSWEDNQVLVFSKGGQLRCRIGNCVEGESNSMVHPRGLDLLNTGTVVICDSKNANCLHHYVYI